MTGECEMRKDEGEFQYLKESFKGSSGLTSPSDGQIGIT